MKQKQKNPDINSLQLLPNSLEAEKAVVGALLIESTAINEVASILSPETFYDSRHGEIYRAIITLYDKGESIDLITVMGELTKSGKLDEVGGPVILAELSSAVASSSHITDHARHLHQLMLSRQLSIACQMIAVKAADQTLDVSDTIDEALKEIENISGSACYNMVSHSIGEAAYKAVELYSKRKSLALQGLKSGIDTGLKDLNFITNGGWKPGQLIILAARPAMGKTALMLHLAKSASLAGTPAMIFSLEMDVQGLTSRMLLSECDVDSYRLASGKLTDDEEMKLCNASDALYSLPVTIDDTPSMSMSQIKIRARNAQKKDKCSIVFIDYLQLVDMRSQNKTYNREQEVTQASRAAKIMAKELGVPVILLSQLSRKVEDRSDKMPLLSDLRESGAIEQDADMVLFIHRPEYYDDAAPKGEGVLRIAKQRDGATGDIRFRYNHSLTKIADCNSNLSF